MTIDEIKKIKLQLKNKIKSNNINYFNRYVIDYCNRNKYIDLDKLGEHEKKEYLFNTKHELEYFIDGIIAYCEELADDIRYIKKNIK
jgi:hypothetical protein|tara:strand:- start:111 stop:371 length:261 start_codon:yes stop_codon:yes gene_type:complete